MSVAAETEAPAGEDLLFEQRGPLVVVTLNRPKALNALTHEMALALETRLKRYAGDDSVQAVLVRGAGERAFCAGGDIRRLYDTGRAGERYPYEFYRDEYRLNALIHHYPKPYIAFIDGICMGGGVGLSVHGSHRIVSERLVFAMPETGIGLFPDVGGSYFLSRLPGEIGMYMAMTGARLTPADAVFAGVGDCLIDGAKEEALIAALIDADYAGGAMQAVDTVLAGQAVESGSSDIAALQGQIEASFSGETLDEILSRLAVAGGEWAENTLATMRSKSPTSMRIAFRQLRRGRAMTFNDCMRMEYRIANGCIQGHDFYEGVRAVVIDKDQTPAWRPARLEDIGDSDVEAYFSKPPADGDLEIPYGPVSEA